MAAPSDPVSDPQRLQALAKLALSDGPPEEAFDRLTRLAARLIGVPVSLVSLVDQDRQVFKSQIGLAEPWATRRETPLSHSFCQHCVRLGEALVIDDARMHPLVRENLAIDDLKVVAYAGIPLRTPTGHILGAFCAIDSTPRHWTSAELTTLHDLAAIVESEIALRDALVDAEVRSRTDPLTGLFNRRHFLEALSDELARARRGGTPPGLLMIDIDHFKSVNDALGHLAGDSVLVGVARRLESSMRPYDVLCRWGGEEFAVLAPAVLPDDLANLADSVRRRVTGEPVGFDAGSTVAMTVSVGAASAIDLTGPEAVIAAADAALLEAKRRGRDHAVLAPRDGDG